jgi:hypothetical protein
MTSDRREKRTSYRLLYEARTLDSKRERGTSMSSDRKLRACLHPSIALTLFGATALASTNASAAPCEGPGAPTTTQTQCLTAVTIPGNPLRSFDISWADADRAEYYLGDRSNAGVDIIDTKTLSFKRTIGGFIGIVLNAAGTAVDNNHSGPDGVTSHGHWLYAGDGNSTLKVIDLDDLTAPVKASIPTGGTTRVDEMALTTNGELLLAANNAEDPPFATLFAANGDAATNSTAIVIKITVDPSIIPAGAGLSLEQPAWDPKTARFYTSIPIIANNPPGCNFGELAGAPITCHGGMLITDPLHPTAVEGAFNPTTNTGVVPLPACSPNGATVGPNDNLLLGCTPGNNPSDTQTTIIDAKTKASVSVNGVTGSDEVWFNRGDQRYYLGASKAIGGAVLGVVNARTKFLIETVPQSSNSHSVAADSKRNLIFVPQVAPFSVVGSGGDITTVGAGICGGSGGCIGVYTHDADDGDHDQDDQ